MKNKIINLIKFRSLRIKFVVAVLGSLLVGPFIADKLNVFISGQFSGSETSLFVSTMIDTVVVTGVILFLTNRMIIKPIKQMANLTKELAEGNLDVETMEVKRNDEIGYLQQELNQMVMNMNQILEKINLTTENINDISGNLSTASEESGNMAEQASSSIQEIANNSQVQVNLVNGLTTSIKEMAGDISTDQGHSIKAISNAANEGTGIINNTVSTITELTQRINKSTITVEELNQFTQRISNFVGAITNIAEQTNLLALNASIEAARAGEHGSGFAVVADEIRELAVESNTAAEDIVGLIKEMKKKSETTVDEMKVGQEKANSSLKAINQADEAFVNIKDRVAKLDHTLVDITEVMNGVADFTEGISAAAQEVAAISEEQSAEAQQTAAIADSLDQIVEDLQELVEQISLYKE
ncbi:methyl-accepting chemotaxis protein [Orenia marismortui]|uniref:methyl-accepting chemotaxis protein n=1 Tax=Orenia marismortui TaxID=46469 RepID=UPI0003AB075C|nr:HAMP domain-containing methyl-accepting chemotaxis protein [Orenia marismortui]